MADAYGGHLEAREKFSTPAVAKTHPLLPGFVHQDHVTLSKAPAKKNVSFSDARKRHEAAVGNAKTELAKTHGKKFTDLPSWAQRGLAQSYIKQSPKPDGTFFTPQQEAQAAKMKFKNEGGLPGAILRSTATSLVPKTFVDIGQGKPIHGHEVVSDLGNAALNFAPAGKAAGLLAGFKGLKKVKDVAETAKAAEAAKIPAEKTAQETVRGALKGARVVRGKQEAGYSAERAARAAAASKHLSDSSLPVEERLARAKGELKGELPKINYKGLTVLDEHSVNTLKQDILDHPHLMPFQKIRAADALDKAIAGQVPQKNELGLLSHIFGEETAAGIGKLASHPLRNKILSTLNIPRSIMASFDLSAPFRQGLVVSTRHPSIFFKNFKPMIKAMGSERFYQTAIDDIQARPTYPMMVEAKLAITRLEKSVGGREEQFASDVAEHIPVVGRGIRGSGRAYTAFLDKTRADVFDHLLTQAQSQGRNVQDEKFLHDLGRYVNAATGRGNLPKGLQGSAKALNTFFFSPRLLASRLDLIFSPVTYAKADPFIRKEALRSMFQLAGTASTLVALASQIPGVRTVTDPRNPDWGKIKIGNTRLDIGGGFQQPLRLFAQLATASAISSTTGKKLNLTANGFGQPTRLDLLLRFFEGKESPLASVGTDYLRNSNQVGQKFSWGSEAYQHLTPLLVQDVRDLYNDRKGGMDGIAAAFAGYGFGGLGFGLQTYPSAKPKPRKSSSGDPYGSSSSSSSGDPYGGTASSGGDPYGP